MNLLSLRLARIPLRAVESLAGMGVKAAGLTGPFSYNSWTGRRKVDFRFAVRPQLHTTSWY